MLPHAFYRNVWQRHKRQKLSWKPTTRSESLKFFPVAGFFIPRVVAGIQKPMFTRLQLPCGNKNIVGKAYMSCTFKLFTWHFECMLASQKVWEVAKLCDFQKCPAPSSVPHRWKQNPLSVGIFDKFGDLQKFTKIYDGLLGYPTNGAIMGPVPGNFLSKSRVTSLVGKP